MSATTARTEVGASYASEPFEPSGLALDRRNCRLTQLQSLRERCYKAAGVHTIDYEVDLIRTLIHDKALDDDFSVAVRERWQTWARNANPFRSELASSAAAEIQSGNQSESDSDAPSQDSAAADPSSQEEDKTSRKRKRRKVFLSKQNRTHAGDSEPGVIEDWDAIRQEREARLRELDSVLPSAFRFDERQLKVYAHRLKLKYINSLDRPFEVKDIHRLTRPSWQPRHLKDSRHPQVSLSVLAGGSQGPSQPNVFIVSFFNSSIEGSKDDAKASHVDTQLSDMCHIDGDSTRDDYVRRICGDGLGGMKRIQTVELLSSHTLLDLQSSLLCWSDEQPERQHWHQRLKRQIDRQNVTLAKGKTSWRGEHDFAHEDSVENAENPDGRFARFTGKRRQTDSAFIVEDKLYNLGARHGDAAHEADYATLFDEWKKLPGNSDAKTGWNAMGGDLDVRLDQLGLIRIGQPYWMLHQGDCRHCFVVDQIRALRPSEALALSSPAMTTSVENATRGSTFIPFPRITWISAPTMLRFTVDDKDQYGLGHRILHWDGTVPVSHPGAGARGSADAGASILTTWQVAMDRTKRKHEGLVRKKQGKCMACSLRKAQVGILGGDRFRLPPASASHNDESSEQDGTVIDGLDEQLVMVCNSCAALLGLPTHSSSAVHDQKDSIELDWERINREKGRHADWTLFPMF